MSNTLSLHDALPIWFNRRYTIQPGWNRLLVPLRDVQQAPEGRSMDLRSVMAVGLFASRLDHSRIVYLDHIRLLD